MAFEIGRFWCMKSLEKLRLKSATHQSIWIFIGEKACSFSASEFAEWPINLLIADQCKLPKFGPRKPGLTPARAVPSPDEADEMNETSADGKVTPSWDNGNVA